MRLRPRANLSQGIDQGQRRGAIIHIRYVRHFHAWPPQQAFGVVVEGPDLTLDNFRTVETMTALVLRLGGVAVRG